jgi:hypothetical protein
MKIYISEISYNKNFKDIDNNLVKVHFKKLLEAKLSKLGKPIFTNDIIKTIKEEKPGKDDIIITFDDVFDWKNVKKYKMDIDEILKFWLNQKALIYPHPKTTYLIESKFYKLFFKDDDIPLTEVLQYSPDDVSKDNLKDFKDDTFKKIIERYRKHKQERIVVKFGNSCCAEKVFFFDLIELDFINKIIKEIKEYLDLTNSLLIVIIQPYNPLIDIGKREFRTPVINGKPVSYFTLNMGKVADNDVPHIEYDSKNRKHEMIKKVVNYTIKKLESNKKLKEFIIHPLIQLRVDVSYTTDPELIKLRKNDNFYLKYESWYTKETIEQLYYVNEIELNSASFFFDNYIQTTDKRAISTMKTQEELVNAYFKFLDDKL